MEITTKYSPENSVFFMHKNIVHHLKIESITIRILSEQSLQIMYSIFGVTDSIAEDNLFANEQDLFKHLAKNITTNDLPF